MDEAGVVGRYRLEQVSDRMPGATIVKKLTEIDTDLERRENRGMLAVLIQSDAEGEI